jgi:hypothetical protein
MNSSKPLIENHSTPETLHSRRNHPFPHWARICVIFQTELQSSSAKYLASLTLPETRPGGEYHPTSKYETIVQHRKCPSALFTGQFSTFKKYEPARDDPVVISG